MQVGINWLDMLQCMHTLGELVSDWNLQNLHHLLPICADKYWSHNWEELQYKYHTRSLGVLWVRIYGIYESDALKQACKPRSYASLKL